jgi:hypothetical protein
MLHCQECEKEIRPGEKESPETWNEIVYLRQEIPMSAMPKSIEFAFCSYKCAMLYLVRVHVR